jgi:hypothetical protein
LLISKTYHGWRSRSFAARPLGDAQQLQLQERRKLEAIDKQVKPPMVGPPSLRNEPASLLPGGVPASVMVDRATADKARKLRAQAQAQQAALAGVQQLANTAKTASQIDVGGGQNMVSKMLGGAPS